METISNVKVYGLEDSVAASKYPMSVDTESCTGEITKTTKELGSCEKGTGHDQFLTGIIVQFDLTLSLKAWTEAQRYHFLDFVSSQSTMHRSASFNLDEQCIKYVTEEMKDLTKKYVSEYKADPTADKYLKILYNIPSGFRLTARMTTNYRQLKTIRDQRKAHRLPEWREICRWIETLPHFKEICLNADNND